MNARLVPLWDLPLRLFHWGNVLLMVALWITAKGGSMPLHALLGEAALALLLFRLVWGFLGSSTARFATFVKGPMAILAYLKTGQAPLGHNPLGALSVLGLLFVLGVLGITGLFASDDIFSEGPLAYLLSAEWVSILSTVHRVGFKVMLGLIGLHLAAILFYRIAKGDNLVWPMLSGSKRVAEGIEGARLASSRLALFLALASAALVFGALAVWGR